jgi:hypothetical protein
MRGSRGQDRPDCRVREAQGLKVIFPEKVGFLSEPHRYKVPYGGRGGIKSWSIAQLPGLSSKALTGTLRYCARTF